tara:strand:- start:199 stop:615 length:417 start_codon:yes stop_codon:yes gene_type:complete
VRVLLTIALLWVGCAEEVDTPHERIQRFTGCPVPAGAVQIEDHLGGDAQQAVTHAKLVLAKDDLRDFLRGCGTSLDAFQPAYDARPLAPAEELDFWELPDRQTIRGAEKTSPAGRTVLILHERDTDVAVYLWARGAAR